VDAYINCKEAYRELCDHEPTIKLFSKDWWLDAVCGEKNWDVILVTENAQVVGAMPYYFRKKSPFNIITLPKLTQTMGPWLKYNPNMKYSTRLSFEKKVFNELINNIPKVAYFRQNFDYSISNWLPFYWKGFKQSTRYTYVVEDLEHLDSVYSKFDRKKREKIRKAEEIVEVSMCNDIELFFKINQMTFQRQELEVPYSLPFLKRLDSECAKRDCRRILLATDKQDRIHSALYVVWDEQSAFLLMSGTNPEFKNSESNTLLTWEAMKIAANRVKKFDFEGSMMENVEEFFRGFGAVQRPYFSIWKINSRLFSIILYARELIKRRH